MKKINKKTLPLAVFSIAALKAAYRKYKDAHYSLESDLEPGDWSKYPRPQLRRESYFNLNGMWKMNGKDIRVPFVPQSGLSGFRGRIGSRLVYEKRFINKFIEDNKDKDVLMKDSSAYENKHVILHFGAVDQVADVYLNDVFVCHHEGGYLPFEADITKVIKPGENKLVVNVTDRLLSRYPYGKQRKNRGGMWYTPVSGIWQSVWLEQVNDIYIKNIKITPCADDTVELEIQPNTTSEKLIYNLEVDLNGFIYKTSSDSNIINLDMTDIKKPDGSLYIPKHWTPDNPSLYNVKISLSCKDSKNNKDGKGKKFIKDGKDNKAKVVDTVSSYFALRTVDIRLIDGHRRICLNGKPIFMHGVLDQGYFCDGIFLPANPNGYENDIRKMKELGFNTLRKHIKIEPEEFYYACDKLGMLVIQDMVNNGRYSLIRDTVLPNLISKKRNDVKRFRNTTRKEIFVKHSEDTVKHLYNHPCIVGYTIFNEGWGQFNSDFVGDSLKMVDNTRFMDYASGWFTQKKSDVESIHVYYKNIKLERTRKPLIVSECGGYSYRVKKHSYSRFRRYGYGNCDSSKTLTDTIEKMYDEMIIPAIKDGLCCSIYTQLSDVEDETNGMYTYDRKVCKVDKKIMQEISKRIYNTAESDI